MYNLLFFEGTVHFPHFLIGNADGQENTDLPVWSASFRSEIATVTKYLPSLEE